MKKILMLSVLVAMASASATAQSIDDIDKMYNSKKYTDAKTAIDKYLSVEKNAASAEGWYYKAKIYNAISYDTSLPKSDIYNLKSTAFDAFKKTQQFDTKDVRLKLEGYKSYLDLYYGMYDLAATEFNRKDYEGSFNSFKRAGEVKDYILSKNYAFTEAKLAPFDTALVLNTAVAATQAKKMDESLKYYNQLADKNLTGPDYIQVYAFLLDNYSKSKDTVNFNRVITKARSLYPGDPYWDETEIAMIPRGGDKTALYAKYDELLAKNPDNYGMAYNYAVEYYNSLYGNDVKPKDQAAAKAKLTQILKIAVKNDKGIDGTVIMANHLYNVAADYSSAASLIKGTKPEDIKKKAELKRLAMASMDETIPYAQAALKYLNEQPKLKAQQQSNQKIMIDYLIDIYGMKADKAKVAEYQKQKSALK